MEVSDSPGIANHGHGALGLPPGDVLRALFLLLLLGSFSLAGSSLLWLRPGAALAGGHRAMQHLTALEPAARDQLQT